MNNALRAAIASGDRFAAGFSLPTDGNQQPAAPTAAAAIDAAPPQQHAPALSFAVGDVNRTTAANSFAAANAAAIGIPPPAAAAATGPAPAAAAGATATNAGGRRTSAASVPRHRNAPTAPSLSLQACHDAFNADGMRQRSREPSTFAGHQRENSKLIIFLYEQHPAYLVPEFLHELEDLDAEIDYSPLFAKRYRGTLTDEQRKVNYRIHLLRELIGATLGPAGTDPRCATVDLKAFTASPEIYAKYIETKVDTVPLPGGGTRIKLRKPGVYSSYKSCLSYLFKRYKYDVPRGYERDVKEFMDGAVRIAAHATQAGEGDIDTSTGLPWPLYLTTSGWFLDLDGEDGIYGNCFAKLTANLACRGDNTKQICTKHLQWSGDSIGIPFAHEKTHQRGNDQTKKLPRHCYSNPLDFRADFTSAVFHYLALHPERIAKPDESILHGTQDAQTTAFNRVLKKVLQSHVDEDGIPLCEVEHGVKMESISMYSFRKCAHTKLNCGSTCGPTSAAACLREGKSLGTARNPYIAQEQASDEFCGRILAGLPVNTPQFAASYPDFVPIDVMASLEKPGVSSRAYQLKKKEVDRQVKAVLESIFGVENLRVFPSLRPFLRIGLASHLHHLEAIEELLSPRAKLRSTPLFTNDAVKELKRHVRIAMPWEDHHIYFAPATGLPPHVVQMNQVEKLQAQVDDLPRVFEQILDDKQMAGPVSKREMRKMIEQNPTIRRVEGIMARVEAFLDAKERPDEPENDGSAESGDRNRGRAGRRSTQFGKFLHPDGVERRIPEGWYFPNLAIQHMYVYWHCGNAAEKIPPIKDLDARDLSAPCLGKKGKKAFSGLKRLMVTIDRAAKRGDRPPKDGMSQAEATSCFVIGKQSISVLETTPTGRPRDVSKLTWSSALKYMTQSRGN